MGFPVGGSTGKMHLFVKPVAHLKELDACGAYMQLCGVAAV